MHEGIEKAKTSKLTHQARRRMIRQVRLANQRLQHVNGGLQYVNVLANQRLQHVNGGLQYVNVAATQFERA